MSISSGLQISLDVRGRSCLVIGGDDEAAEKTNRLLDAEAKVTVISPTLNDTLRKLTASGKIIHRGRHFRSTDSQGVMIILNVVREDKGLARSLFELAGKERFLVWSIDQPELSSVAMPAVVNRGLLRVAISTSGASPALASRLRQQSEDLFDEDFVLFLDWLGSLRDHLKEHEPNESRRREQLRKAVDGFHLRGSIEYPLQWREEQSKKAESD